jgi:hypothetical protein
MKKNILIPLLLIGLLTTSCTVEEAFILPDENNSTTQDLKRFKKVDRYRGGLFFDKTVYYDATYKIDSIVVNKYLGGGAPYYSAISVVYDGNEVASIKDSIDYESPFVLDSNVTYDVTFENNEITLLSQNREITITHANGYVESIIERSLPDGIVQRDSYLTRDSDNNLTSIAFSNGMVVNSYADFDSDKKPNPDGPVIDIMHPDYLKIFGLQLTANNPRSSAQSILGSEPYWRTYAYEYDAEGYVVKIIDPNQVDYTDTYYVED